jgi:hypothetical protein
MLEPAASADVIERRAQAPAIRTDRVAGRASAFALVDGLADCWVAWGFFRQACRADLFYEGYYLPGFLCRDAHGWHICAGDSVIDGGVELGVGAALAILTSGEVGAPAAFSAGSVAVGALSLEEGSALFGGFWGVERVLRLRWEEDCREEGG